MQNNKINNMEQFIKTLNDPYDIMISICIGQFKNLLDSEDFDSAHERLKWVKNYVKLQDNVHRSNT